MLPEEVCLKSLDESHIAEMNENWRYKDSGSFKFLVHELKLNFGLGNHLNQYFLQYTLAFEFTNDNIVLYL